MSEYDMNYALTELKEQHPWLRNYHSKMLQMVCKQVAAARKAATGRLKYRKDDDYNAFTYNQTGFRIDKGVLTLSKIGGINVVLHRSPVKVKQVTVCRRMENGMQLQHVEYCAGNTVLPSIQRWSELTLA